MAKPLAPPLPPSRPGKPGGLGEKVEATVERIFHWLTTQLMETIAGWVGWALELFMHALRPGMLAVFGPFLRFYRDLKGTPPEFQALINNALSEEGEAGAAILGMVGSSVGGAAIGSVTSSLFAPLTYAVNRIVRPARADPATAIANAWRHNLDWDSVNFHTDDTGWHADYIQQLAETLRPRTDVGNLLALWRREKLAEGDLNSELGARGYEPSDIAQLKQATELIPGPGDLISMAVREAFSPDIVAKYGYGEGFPAEFGEWMEKQGDVDGWARKYWTAHWRMPGLAQALDALYRLDDFGLDELDDFLRTADIAPAWRGIIKRTAYRTLARVDIRRMYAMGVLDPDALLRKYLAFGYNAEDAALMTEFTIRFETDESREATKSDILSFLATGALSESEALGWLQQIGYPGDLAAYLVAREIMKSDQARIKIQTGHIENLYTHGEIDLSQASSQMAALGLPAGEIEQKLSEWQIAREAKVRRPSLATLDKFFKSDTITQAQYTDGLAALGYQADYIAWYLDDILRAKAELSRREEEKARTEQEDIRKRKTKSDYQIAKAELDVDLAEIATAISETQLALRARQQRYQVELRVAHEALSAAELEDLAEKEISAVDQAISAQGEAIAFLQEQIELLQSEMVDIQLQALPQPRTLSAGEVAMAIRAREVEISQHQAVIEALQTEVAGIKLEMSKATPALTPEEADRQIKERQLQIELVQDDIAALGIEISVLRLERVVVEALLSAEEAEKQLLEHRLAIELAQDDIKRAQLEIVGLRRDIQQRRIQLQEELRLIERVRAADEVEQAWLADQMEIAARLADLRLNLAALREQKAHLAVEYRVGLVPEGG